MSASEPTFDELRRMFTRGEIDADELRERLTDLPETTDRDELWARWSEQGVFDEPIEDEGWTSFKNGQPRERE